MNKMIKYRKAQLEDLPLIQKIAYKTWPITFGEIISAEQIKYMLDLIYSEASLREQIVKKGHIFILAEKDGQAVGFTSYELNYRNNPKLMIHKLYILPESQGFGIGAKFLNLISDIALKNNNKSLHLKVYFENKKAIDFYEKNGFIKIENETTDIGKNYKILDDVMVKKLE